MGARRKPAGRSPKKWAVRLGLAGLALVLGLVAVTFTLAQLLVKQNPALAHRLAPYDGRITAAYATALAGVDATSGNRTRSDTLAKLALRQDPTAVAALATLGINADVRGDKAAARRYFRAAQKLSRRDLRTQLYMIEDAVQRNDIPGTLHQYDMTLRVFPTLGDVLYPVLTSASADPVIRRELVRMLAGKPAWSDSFFAYVANNDVEPKTIAALFIDLRRAGVAVPEALRAGAVTSLLAGGYRDVAWSYYLAIRPGADRRRSRDPRFAAALETPSPFDWAPVNDGGLSTDIQGGIFDYTALASFGGPMLRQVQLLPPGVYHLSGHSIGIEAAANAAPYWSLLCQDGRELGRVEVPGSATAGGNFGGAFSVPADCPVQTLILSARPSDAVSASSGQFDRVELAPAR